jgi:hypothetical protein
LSDEVCATKRCARCCEVKPLAKFSPHTKRPDGLQSYCSSCGREAANAWNAANPEKRAMIARAGGLKRKFGLTVDDYDILLERQGGVCAICREVCPSGRRLAVDHKHETGVVRKLLCTPCNTALGSFKDSPDRLASALAYLLDHGEVLTNTDFLRRPNPQPNREAYHGGLQ